MCIAIPGRVLETKGKTARVDFYGKPMDVRADFVSVNSGDHVLVFGDTVIEIVSKERADQIMKGLGGLL